MVMLHTIALGMEFTHIKQGIAPKVKLQTLNNLWDGDLKASFLPLLE